MYTFSPQEDKLNSPPPKWELYLVICFQIVQYGKGERVTLKRKNLINMTSARWLSLSSAGITIVDGMYCWYNVFRMTIHLHGLPKIHNPSLTMGKTSEKPQLRVILQNYWPVLLTTIKVIKNKKNLKNYHRPE